MATQKNGDKSGAQQTAFYNPGPKWELDLPGKRRNMANKKSGKKNAKKAAAGKGKSKSNPKRTTKRASSKAKGNPKRRARRAERNPIMSGAFLGLRPVDLLGGAIGLLGDGILQLVVPDGWIGIVIRGGGAVAMVKWLPRSVGPAAGIAAGAMVTRDALNKAFNVSGLINAQVTKFLPKQTASAGGMAGVARIGQARVR